MTDKSPSMTERTVADSALEAVRILAAIERMRDYYRCHILPTMGGGDVELVCKNHIATIAELDRLTALVEEAGRVIETAANELDLAAQKTLNLHALLSRGLFAAADRARSFLSKLQGEKADG
jgi:hypothetical protein